MERNAVWKAKRKLKKNRARRKTRTAIRNGRLIRPKACEVCGQVRPIQAHHDDYNKPLKVRWLCSTCHTAHHLEEKKARKAKMPKRARAGKLLKPREVADRLGVQPRTVARYLRDGTLQGVKMNGHSWRVEEIELERFIRESRVTP